MIISKTIKSKYFCTVWQKRSEACGKLPNNSSTNTFRIPLNHYFNANPSNIIAFHFIHEIASAPVNCASAFVYICKQLGCLQSRYINCCHGFTSIRPSLAFVLLVHMEFMNLNAFVCFRTPTLWGNQKF